MYEDCGGLVAMRLVMCGGSEGVAGNCSHCCLRFLLSRRVVAVGCLVC